MKRIDVMTRHGITLPEEQIKNFCARWDICELAVFGSFLRNDFGDHSDIDFLYRLKDDASVGIDDAMTMESELAAIVGRNVELVRAIDVETGPNYIRRNQILATAEPIYVQR